MRLASMQLHTVELPKRRDHRWTNLTGSIGRYLLLELTDGDGNSGWGEATALGSWGGDHGRYYGETNDTARYVLAELIAPVVLGIEFTDRNALLRAAERSIQGHFYAKTAFEEALLDLVARRHGVPVYELLGGRRRDRIPLAHSLGLMPADEAVAEARIAVDDGVRTIKIKVGANSDHEIELVKEVFAAVGNRAVLALDANQGWKTATEAERFLLRLADIPLKYVEQPVIGIREFRALATRSPFPLMADESMWNAFDLVDLATQTDIAYASVYTSKAGGLRGALTVDAVATAFQIGTNVNGSGETGVGNLANVHLAATMQSLTLDCVVPLSHRADDPPAQVAGRFYLDDVLSSSFVFDAGDIIVPDGPGWGIDVDRDQLSNLTRHHESIVR